MSFKTLFLPASAAVALALAAPTCAQEATSTDSMPASARPGPALWQVSDEDTTIYLFGTVHVLPADTQWLDQRLEGAFAASNEVVFETDLDDAAGMQQMVIAKAALTEGGTVRDLMNAEDRAQYEAALQTFGMPEATFDAFEPWMAAMTLSVLPLMSAGYNVEAGVEAVLNGRVGEKTKGTLETAEEQIDLFDTLPMEMQLTYLDETVEAIPETAGKVDQMVSHWLEGDAVSLAELLNEELDDPELYSRLLTNRNANWADWIDARMDQPGTVFMAVGAGHLAGRDSVQELLEARGLEVTRIWE